MADTWDVVDDTSSEDVDWSADWSADDPALWEDIDWAAGGAEDNVDTSWDWSGAFDWFGEGDTATIDDVVDTIISGDVGNPEEIPNAALPGAAGYGWKYYTDGTAISPDGKYYFQGEEVYDPNSGNFSGVLSKLLKTAGSAAKKAIFNDGDASKGINLAGLATLAAGAYSMFGGSDVNSGGWQEPVKKFTAVREAVPYDDTNRRPGEGGRRYFTDTTYVPEGGDVEAAKTAATEQAAGIAALAPAREAPQDVVSTIPMSWNTPSTFNQPADQTPPTTESFVDYDQAVETAEELADPKATASASSMSSSDIETLRNLGSGTPSNSLAGTTESTGLAELLAAKQAAGPSYNTSESKYSDTPSVNSDNPSSMIPTPVASPDGDASEILDMLQNAPTMARGGQVPSFRKGLETNGFVIPGDVVAHADPMGQANKERGLRALHQGIGVEAIRGPGDAMSDSIPTTIDGREPARVANGEAYVPRQNVERIGGGDVDNGTSRLYDIMDRLRQQRTGSTKQINPDNPQELRAAYGGNVQRMAAGGGVRSFAGTEGSAVTSTSYGNTASGNLSEWVGDYATTALGEGAAAAALPYQAYEGPLTAGASDLQTQAFAGAQQMANTGFTPTQFSGGVFDTAAAQQYMNPYLQAALNPQMEEMRRQADISRLADAGRLTQAGAFGGSRQAIMESEGRRNLLDKQRQALGEGYATAYDKAMAQFNADQNRRMQAAQDTEASRRYGAEFGRQSIADLANYGATQRAIEQEGIDADKAQFEEERNWQYELPKYKLGLLSGLPVSSTATTPNTTGLSQIQTQLGELGTMYTKIEDALKALGQG